MSQQTDYPAQLSSKLTCLVWINPNLNHSDQWTYLAISFGDTTTTSAGHLVESIRRDRSIDTTPDNQISNVPSLADSPTPKKNFNLIRSWTAKIPTADLPFLQRWRLFGSRRQKICMWLTARQILIHAEQQDVQRSKKSNVSIPKRQFKRTWS